MSAAPAERGSVLMLMPAAVLIVIVLGSIAVDFAIAFLGEREAASLAAAAANDAATAAVDEQAFRRTGEFRIDEARARRVARAALEASSSELDAIEIDVAVTTAGGEPAVTVTVRGTVHYVFAPAIPGAPHGTEVEATATAVARVGS
jgi:Flp pilus assembly protein TadG